MEGLKKEIYIYIYITDIVKTSKFKEKEKGENTQLSLLIF